VSELYVAVWRHDATAADTAGERGQWKHPVERALRSLQNALKLQMDKVKLNKNTTTTNQK
jgi:hypothetical protein